MTIDQHLMQRLCAVPTPATVLAKALGLNYESVASRLSAMHKAGLVRAESKWMPHSKKPVLFYFVEARP